MAVSLMKGQKISLSKECAGLSSVTVGLGWDEAQKKKGLFSRKERAIDCDASAILLTDGKLAGKEDIVYYAHLNHNSGSVVHRGDNLTGAGEGDDEQIMVDLARVPHNVDRIVFVVNIYQAVQRGQHFGMIKNAFIRIVDNRNNTEICRYNLTDDYNGCMAMIFGEIYKHNGEWKFNAVGQGTADPGLSELANRFR
ncbi:MAG: TerD family protein [Ruminococcus flavefaciens]|nr:TerD family protein [Ruminococcus flavefaciens]